MLALRLRVGDLLPHLVDLELSEVFAKVGSPSSTRQLANPDAANLLKVAEVSHSLALALSAEFGRQAFSFLREDLTQALEETHTDYFLNAGVGYSRISRSTKNPLFYASLSYSEGERYTAARSRQICTPVPGTSSTECRTSANGPPTKDDARAITLDLRSWSYGQRLAFNPRFVHERATEGPVGVRHVQRTAELAISYLVLAADSGVLDKEAFTAGVRIGYQRGRQNGAFLAVFFGTVLHIPGLNP